jgi:TPR repeat protein
MLQSRIAVRFLKMGALQGNAASQYSLAMCYAQGETGESVEVPNNEEAAKYFKLAVDQGEKEAQVQLAIYYKNGYHLQNGDRVPSDQLKAEYFRRAAEQGLASAQYGLALCYAEAGNGVVVPTNQAEAIRYHCLAAEQHLD